MTLSWSFWSVYEVHVCCGVTDIYSAIFSPWMMIWNSWTNTISVLSVDEFFQNNHPLACRPWCSIKASIMTQQSNWLTCTWLNRSKMGAWEGQKNAFSTCPVAMTTNSRIRDRVNICTSITPFCLAFWIRFKLLLPLSLHLTAWIT